MVKIFDIENAIVPHLAKIQPYEPAEPIEAMAARVGIPVDKIIRLNANENPFGPSPKVSEALSNLSAHIYPDPLQKRIRSEIGKYTGFAPSHIIAGAGSDELIDLMFRLFVCPGDTVIDCDPTFGMYSFCAKIAGAEINSVPRNEKFDIDIASILDSIDSKTKILLLSSPNNPTGNVDSLDHMRSLLDTGLLVVVDEAYYEFCNKTAAGLLFEYSNLVILRTFSKWAGLAGLRVGYSITNPLIVERIINMKSPYNVNSAAEVAVLASLEDKVALLERVKSIVKERERLFSILMDIDGLLPLPSGGNFILCHLQQRSAREIFDEMATRGIFFRMFSHERLRNYFRITVGKPEQNDTVARALAEVV